MTYSCQQPRAEVVELKEITIPGFPSAQFCRFDLRYTELHQSLGCAGCTKPWDSTYLRQVGLLKK
jgi:hypothetical protein